MESVEHFSHRQFGATEEITLRGKGLVTNLANSGRMGSIGCFAVERRTL